MVSDFAQEPWIYAISGIAGRTLAGALATRHPQGKWANFGASDFCW